VRAETTIEEVEETSKLYPKAWCGATTFAPAACVFLLTQIKKYQ
jgi:hypothetical protein